MNSEELKKPSYTIKQAAEMLGVHERTVVRMLEDKRLEGQLVDTLRGKVWLITPISIATLLVRKSDSGSKQYPKTTKKEDK
jgi:excisionase family DNA binding protein